MEKELHTVGLGEVRRVAPRNRASKAMKLLKEYVERHARVEKVSVSNAVNEHLWGNGAKNPPKKVEVQVLVDEGTAHVELTDMEFELEEDEEAEEAETVQELTDEEIAEKNVGEVKELVDAGAVEAQRALDIEYAGKNRKTLIEWLQGRVGEEAAEEPEEVDEEKAAGEEPEESVEEEPEEEEVEEEETGAEDEAEEDSAEETYDLSDDVIAVFEDGTIGDGKEAAKELGKSEFEKLLNFEETHQDRKGMKKWLRSNMN